MITIILILHILIAVVMICVIMLQSSEGGALGMGGGTASGMMSARGTSNLLTRSTAILATCFIATSITLAILSGRTKEPSSVIGIMESETNSNTPTLPKKTGPSVPLSK